MAYDNQKLPVKKNALDNRKLCLFAPAPNNSERQAILMWSVFSNNPRITVFTGDPSDNNETNYKGRISANLDGPVFFTFIEMLERVAKSKTHIALKIQNKNYIWKNNERSKVPTIVSELHVGKQEDGAIYISVIAENRPNIKFYITPSDWHTFLYADGKPLDKTELITMHALGYCNLLRGLVTGIMLAEYTEPVQRVTDTEYSRPQTTREESPSAKLPDNLADEDIPF